MATSDRPSGLTALAVIQFIFCVIEGFGVIGYIAMRLIAEQVPENPDGNREAVAIASVSWWNIIVLASFSAISALLLLVSGIGYLKRKRILGRWLGNAYSVVAIANVISVFILLPEEVTGGMSLDLIRGFFYPLFLVLLLNGVFRKDLVR